MRMIVVIILSIFSFCSMSTSADPVLDTTGRPIQQGEEYHILPADGNKGGLALDRQNTRCPLDVCEELTPKAAANGGVPVTFAPLRSNETLIHTSTDFNIAFSTATNRICNVATVWRMGKFDRSTRKWRLTIGGAVGKPGAGSVSNWLRLEKEAGNRYKFVFCPKVCNSCKVTCGDIGVVGGNTRKRLLGISKVPLKVVFKRETTDPYY